MFPAVRLACEAVTVFETERLVIRDWTEEPADLARVYDIYSRWEVSRWLGVTPVVLTEPAQAATVVRGWRDRHAGDAGRFGTWAVQVRDTGVVAGTVLLIPLPGRDGTRTDDVEVGWHLHPDSWGRGYATEAAAGAVRRAFAAGIPQVYAVVKPGNDASMAVARRLGMIPLGRTNHWYGGTELEAFVRHGPRPGQRG